MSESVPDENHELAKVLSRINTLMGQAEKQQTVHAEGVAVEKSIPQLTDVYEGEPLSFVKRSADDFPFLSEALDQSVIDGDTLIHSQQPKLEVVDALLAEMLPIIRATIQRAVLQELESSEQSLRARLELEIMQSLRENLQSRLP